jgi:hypothetical protein
MGSDSLAVSEVCAYVASVDTTIQKIINVFRFIIV